MYSYRSDGQMGVVRLDTTPDTRDTKHVPAKLAGTRMDGAKKFISPPTCMTL